MLFRCRSAPPSSDRGTSPSFIGTRHLEPGDNPAGPLERRRARVVAASIAIGICILFPRLAAAQSCASPPPSTRIWSAPLDRPVSLPAADLSLRESLDRVAAVAGVHLSYANESIPQDIAACVHIDSLRLGDALTWLLRNTSVAPVSAGGAQVALVPIDPEAPGGHPISPRTLDRVVVTGSTLESPARPLTVAMNVVSGAQLSRYAQGNIGQALSDAVPGLWVWQSAPTSLLSHYGSIRGTSSFGASYPKIYVDGIELANPLLVTQFTPESVDRIEVIRGPQGAALYGSDAINGVINIVMRHDGSNGGPGTVVRTAVGTANSAYVPRSAITQDHAIAWRTGSNEQSANVSFTSGGVGEYLPNAFARHTTAGAGFRLVRDHLIATGTARVFSSESADPSSPFFRDSANLARFGAALPQSVQEYTIGGSATIVQGDHWTHTLVAGFDGSRLSNLANDPTPLPSGAGPDLGTVSGNANLGTLRMSSVGRMGDDDGLAATVTLAAENSLLDFRSHTDTSSQANVALASAVRRWTTAAVTQANISWKNTGYLTGGLRVEQNTTLENGTVSVLPMLGAALVHDYGLVTVKLRSAYGRGIRPAATPVRDAGWFDPHRSRMLDLAPEQQSGIEAGVDVFVGKRLSLQLTRFDQLASGLIQRVAYVASEERAEQGAGYLPPSQTTNPDDRHISYVLQNVGEITNRGWELKSDWTIGALSLSGAYSTVDSRVRRVARSYAGDLRVGDRMLEVPGSTGSFVASWVGAGWTGSLAASRSWNWIDYDRIALADAFSSSTQADAQLVGSQLRNYWLRYSGVTRLRASVGKTLFRGFSISISGENLLNRQHGEPDNVTVVPGRSLSFGLKALM
jgi:iron complex outermembrane receptor protein